MKTVRNYCQNCGAEIRKADAEFCSHCGKPLAKRNVCPSCGKALPEQLKFCVFCGTELSASEQTPVLFQEPIPQPEQAEEPGPLVVSLTELAPETEASETEENADDCKELLPPSRKNVRRSRSRWVIAAVVAAIILAGGALTYFFTPVGQATNDLFYVIKARELAKTNALDSIPYIDKVSDAEKYQKMLSQVYYEIANVKKSEKKYVEAISYYLLCSQEQDCAETLSECYYCQGEKLLKYQQYEVAIGFFEKSKGYNDALSQFRINSCYYGIGEEQMERKEYAKAVESFNKANGYSDSYGKIKKCNLHMEREEEYGKELSLRQDSNTGYKEYPGIAEIYAEKIGNNVRFTAFYKIPFSCGYNACWINHFSYKMSSISANNEMFQFYVDSDLLIRSGGSMAIELWALDRTISIHEFHCYPSIADESKLQEIARK